MIVKCRTAIQALFLYLTLCPSVMLNNLSNSFTSIFFLTKWYVMFKSKQHWCVCTSWTVESGSCLCEMDHAFVVFYIATVYVSTQCNTHIAVVIWVDHRISNLNISFYMTCCSYSECWSLLKNRENPMKFIIFWSFATYRISQNLT